MIKLVLIILTVSTMALLLALLFMRGWLIETMRKELKVLNKRIDDESLERAEWQRAFEKKHQAPWTIHKNGKTA